MTEDAKNGVFGDITQPGKSVAFAAQAVDIEEAFVKAIDNYGKAAGFRHKYFGNS